MPSFLSKFSKKPNPYMNTHHPGHNPIPQTTAPYTTASCTSNSQSPQANQLRPVSPRGASDLLAEARQVAGRDPVTGRLRADLVSQTASERSLSNERNPLADLRQVEKEERTAYQNRAVASKQTTGNKYELYVQEALAKREEEARVRAARGGIEYYAPERRLEEYYSGGVRD
ncbi:hypothetical protein BKA66DRAFT_452759 [Pyrenochaeta sp. MPI-SDFR-AT-0127]|nr:hypothetical protein BKA66DRAFT_452759 [Pyrenochaeta sp. MPI-SDFR-AT-0127]